MKLKSLARAAAVAAMVAVAGTTLPAHPAAAATTLTWYNSQGQFDNDPANGAQAWVWVWTVNPSGAKIEWQFYDGTGGSLSVGAGASTSASLAKDVWRIRVCEVTPGWGYPCSDWKS
ncbi:hypothetical protein [Streptosporangium roseum]|uniref:Secreted protein n=1 Tax=Streptosporangium roseum (strain ATCC 12428 / DSM 43021 / JCM 3005 / KCTC 9067 / NCIMB 10171 / NRRL 2505 / NI 9100) TaxID=479432 RepID=D2B595_STRRD|nr:hypothetical protein [Streptosporangium roseum]ACZ87619.1 hypothetical protein Sros_4791 [Streptosporangium roseum DSM 43021]